MELVPYKYHLWVPVWWTISHGFLLGQFLIGHPITGAATRNGTYWNSWFGPWKTNKWSCKLNYYLINGDSASLFGSRQMGRQGRESRQDNTSAAHILWGQNSFPLAHRTERLKKAICTMLCSVWRTKWWTRLCSLGWISPCINSTGEWNLSVWYSF